MAAQIETASVEYPLVEPKLEPLSAAPAEPYPQNPFSKSFSGTTSGYCLLIAC